MLPQHPWKCYLKCFMHFITFERQKCLNLGTHAISRFEDKRSRTCYHGIISQCSHWKVHGCSVAQSCPTFYNLMTAAHQPPLSMEFSRQEYWSGLPFPSPGKLPNSGSNLKLLCLLHWQADFYHCTTWEAYEIIHSNLILWMSSETGSDLPKVLLLG